MCGNNFNARSEYRIYSKDGMREAKFRYPDGGFRGWVCVIPVTLGDRKRYFWLTFDCTTVAATIGATETSIASRQRNNIRHRRLDVSKY